MKIAWEHMTSMRDTTETTIATVRHFTGRELQMAIPSSICSLLDNDLYKINMMCAVHQHFPNINVEYTFTNRSQHMRLNEAAVVWLQAQIQSLHRLRFEEEEITYLRTACPYLKGGFLTLLSSFQLNPEQEVTLSYTAFGDGDLFDIGIHIAGSWLNTILYEIPILALVSEAYFKFVDTDWDHEHQAENAYQKATALYSAGCAVIEFGSRRRRDLKTQKIVLDQLIRAQQDYPHSPGALSGTSNVHLARKHGLQPIGTIAHEWYMAIAAIHDDYARANELALQYWLDTWGAGVLGIALTDTFGTPDFFKAFGREAKTRRGDGCGKTFAEVYAGLRQDSGDPERYVERAAGFYESMGIGARDVVFSDSLDVEKCIRYKSVAEGLGFRPSFGIGTHLTNDSRRRSNPNEKSQAMNIVIKISRAAGRPCVKLSDVLDKNTGDEGTVAAVKKKLGYATGSST